MANKTSNLKTSGNLTFYKGWKGVGVTVKRKTKRSLKMLHKADINIQRIKPRPRIKHQTCKRTKQKNHKAKDDKPSRPT